MNGENQKLEKYRNLSDAAAVGEKASETAGNGKNTRFVVQEGRT